MERQDSQIKGENQLNSLSEAMNFMTKKFEVSERERQKKDNIIDTMKSDMVNINEKMRIDLTSSDLDRTHRIGQRKAPSKKPRAVIIKFVSYNTRKFSFLNKKLLKETQVSIVESLTAKRMGILKKAREKHQFRNVWTADAKILYKDGKDNKVKLYYD